MLEAAVGCLACAPGAQLLARSDTHVTAPVGPPQPDFLNAAVRLRWRGTAHGLLDTLLHVEALIGRVRQERWGPRAIDLDLLWWTGPDVCSERLTVPHPELWGRAFALAPLLQVAPELAGRGEAALRAAGGRPPHFPAAAHGPLPAVSRHADAAEAVAAAATAFAESLWPPPQPPPRGGGTWPMAWDPTPENGSLGNNIGTREQWCNRCRYSQSVDVDYHGP